MVGGKRGGRGIGCGTVSRSKPESRSVVVIGMVMGGFSDDQRRTWDIW